MPTKARRKMLQAREVAPILDVSQHRVYQLVEQGVLPAVRLGRQIRFDPDALERWIAGGGQALPGGWRRGEDDAA